MQLPIHRLGPDLIYDKSLRDSMGELGDAAGAVLFSPFMFCKEDLTAELSESQLTGEELLHYGKLATTAKARFVCRKSDCASHDGDHLTSEDFKEQLG